MMIDPAHVLQWSAGIGKSVTITDCHSNSVTLIQYISLIVSGLLLTLHSPHRSHKKLLE